MANIQLTHGMTLKNKQGAALTLTHETVQDDAIGPHKVWRLTNPVTGNHRHHPRAEILVAIEFGHLEIVEAV